jgi:hypothetical protein
MWFLIVIAAGMLILSDASSVVNAYEVDCTAWVQGVATKFVVKPCISALFSPASFDITGIVWKNESDDFGCTESNVTNLNSKLQVKIVRRGQCSFEQKTRLAIKENFMALLIVDAHPPAAPVGAGNASFASEIPVMMTDETVIGHILSSAGNSQIKLHIFKKEQWNSHYLPNLHKELLEHIPVLKMELSVVFLVSFASTLYVLWKYIFVGSNISWDFTFFWRVIVWLLTFGILLLIFMVSRISTLRRMEPPNSFQSAQLQFPLLEGYNHIETDEIIFETLIRSVRENFNNYSLQDQPILSAINLPRENYDHPLFIHPPFFVYASSFLHYNGGIPLPLIPVLFQAGTFLCISWLVSACHSSSMDFSKLLRVSLRAAWLFLICPLSWFCSQKVWIDNALMFTCTFSLTIHLSLLPCAPTTACYEQTWWWICKHVLSGTVFGGLALNTKITAVALLPAVLIWSVWNNFCRHFQQASNRQLQEKKKSFDEEISSMTSCISWKTLLFQPYFILETLCGIFAFVFAATVCHVPWLLWYHGRTGRWLPSAWPSAAMIAQSTFVRAAVTQQSWLFYFQQFASVLPLFFLALCIGFGSLFLIGSSCTSVQEIVGDTNFSVVSILSVYLYTFVLGMTILGIFGAGYQTRFLLPCSPAVAIIVSTFLETISTGMPPSSQYPKSNIASVLFVWMEQFIYLIVIVSVINGWYYGVQFPTKYADINAGGVLDFIAAILGSIVDNDSLRLLQDIPDRQQALQKLLQSYGYRK